ncbi:MAG: 4Fe-4S binding protein, partial [Bacilli bacterium]|nr:4Fe-4S binding protein [Bacilli bacterium]
YNIMFRYPDALAKQMYLYRKPLSELFVRDILEGKGERIPYHFDKKVLSFLLRIEWIAPKVNAPLIHTKKNKCTGCLFCLKACPTGAIYQKKNGKLGFKASRCAMCMKCAMNCPKDAIAYGIMNPWKVNGPFAFEQLANNPDIDPRFVHEGMKGYFRHFVRYFKKQDALLNEHGIPLPY